MTPKSATNDNTLAPSVDGVLAQVLPGPWPTKLPETVRVGRRGVEQFKPCERCGEKGWYGRAVYAQCARCVEELAVERRAEAIAAAVATIPEEHRDARFGAPVLETWVSVPALIELAQAIAPMQAQHVAFLTGGSGRGKSTLAAAMLRTHLDPGARADSTPAERHWAQGVFWVDARALAMARRESGLGDEPALIRRARQASVLVLDDLGQESQADKDDVAALLADRFRERRPTIVTYGGDVDRLAERYGSNIERRLTQRGGYIDLGSDR